MTDDIEQLVAGPGKEGLRLYVLSKEDDRWPIAAGANTIVL